MTTVVFAVPPGVHLLDLAGPAQAFSMANDHGADYRLEFVGAHSPIVSHQGLPVAVSVTWPRVGRHDIVVVPGHRAARDHPNNVLAARELERLRAHHGAGGRVASVCVGAFALAEAGLLDGRRATTHHYLQDVLARRYPTVDVVKDVLYVVDGRVATSAGVASGIDLALHLLSDDLGPKMAARVARTMVVPSVRGGESPQNTTTLRHRDHAAEAVHHAQDLLESRLADRVTLAELAAAVGLSERTLTRQFRSAAGTTPLRYQQALRLERADLLVGQGWTSDAAARDVGLRDARMLRRLRAASTPPGR